MRLTEKERKYLREFPKQARKEGSDGCLSAEVAAQRSGVDYEGGKLAQRLAQQNLLRQKRPGFPEFAITALGEEPLRSWWARKPTVLALILITILGGLAVAAIWWAVEKFFLK